ncbi:MAG: hypothetical protein ACI4AB_00845 [Acetatifactor sp.]
MDMNGTNGMASGTYGLTDIPLGFGFALAMNEPAMGAYAALSETEKEQLIMKCRDAKSKEEMQRIVDSLVTDRDAAGIMAEERDKLS